MNLSPPTHPGGLFFTGTIELFIKPAWKDLKKGDRVRVEWPKSAISRETFYREGTVLDVGRSSAVIDIDGSRLPVSNTRQFEVWREQKKLGWW